LLNPFDDGSGRITFDEDHIRVQSKNWSVVALVRSSFSGFYEDGCAYIKCKWRPLAGRS